MEYLELLQKALGEELGAVRLYLACMALAPPGDMGTLLEINKDETDHMAQIATLISMQSGQGVDYAKQIPGVD